MKTKNKELEEIIEKYDLVGKSVKELGKIIDFKIPYSVFESIKYNTKETEPKIILAQKINTILEYINLHYALPKSAITELSKYENVREILVKYGLVEENKLEVGKWYKSEYPNSQFLGFLMNEHSFYGFDYRGDWCYGHSYDNQSKTLRLATPQEIESMLIKKLEADGLKVGSGVDCGENLIYEVKPNFKYYYAPLEDILFVDSFIIYEKGKFAKIIQPELTLEQRIERLEKLNNL